MYETAAGDAGCVSGFSCCARKAQASRFGTKTQLAGRTLTPMPPVGGELMVELRHKSDNAHWRSRLLRGVGRVVPTCAVLQADCAPCRSAPRKRRVRPPCGAKGEGWHQASSRLTNRTQEMIHDKTVQPTSARKIPSASAVCARYHG